ncbi:MAG: META domain-containing protein, partial [Nodosilinea sp.]
MNSPSLEGPLWGLTHYIVGAGQMAEAESYSTRHPSIQFANGQISGNGTCNRFFGSYKLESNNLIIQPGGSTLMAGPPAAMAQEQAFMAALGKVSRYAIVAAKLHLLEASDSPLLVFRELVPLPLIGTRWALTAYNNGRGGVTSGLAGTHITATFDSQGILSGSAGCNTYRAGYTAQAGTIAIAAATTTRQFCPQPEGVMAQEAAYLTALTTASRYFLEEENRLTLKTDAGATV